MKSVKAFLIAGLFMSIVVAPHLLAEQTPIRGSSLSARQAATADPNAAIPSLHRFVHALRQEARLMVEQSFRFE